LAKAAEGAGGGVLPGGGALLKAGLLLSADNDIIEENEEGLGITNVRGRLPSRQLSRWVDESRNMGRAEENTQLVDGKEDRLVAGVQTPKASVGGKWPSILFPTPA
jgi:hypothetical protein